MQCLVCLKVSAFPEFINTLTVITKNLTYPCKVDESQVSEYLSPRQASRVTVSKSLGPR